MRSASGGRVQRSDRIEHRCAIAAAVLTTGRCACASWPWLVGTTRKIVRIHKTLRTTPEITRKCHEATLGKSVILWACLGPGSCNMPNTEEQLENIRLARFLAALAGEDELGAVVRAHIHLE